MIEYTKGIKNCTECPFYLCFHDHTAHICTAFRYMVILGDTCFYLDSRQVDRTVSPKCPLKGADISFRFLVDK